MNGQTQIPEALMGAMMLEQSAQKGQFRPTTPDGQPTVAAQLMQKAMPPTVPQVAQQAGLAAQIQAMQQQQAQEAMMQQAMAQQQRPAGIEALNPQVGGFAEGGVVGYSGAMGSYVPLSPSSVDPEDFARQIEVMNAEAEARRAERERREMEERMPWLKTAAPETAARIAASQPVPAATVGRTAPGATAQDLASISAPVRGAAPVRTPPPGGAPAAPRAGIAAALPPTAQAEYDKAFAALERSKDRTVSPEAVGAEATGMTAAQRAFMKAQGTDPDLLRTLAEEASRRGEERGRYYDTQAEAARRKAKDEGLMNFLLGARGRGFGEVLSSGARAAQGADAAAEAEGQRLMELKFKAQDAAVKDRQLLQKAQFEIDMGQFDKARKTLDEREKNRQTYERAEASARAGYGKELAEYARMIRGQDIQREVGLARTDGSDITQRARGLQTLITNLQKDLSDVEKSVRKEDREKAIAIRGQLDAYRRELAGLIGVEAPAVPAAPTAAGGRPPLSSFQR